MTYTVFFEQFAVFAFQGSIVTATGHVGRPSEQGHRKLHCGGAPTRGDQSLVTMLPSVAEGTMVHSLAIQINEAWDIRKLVSDTCCEKQFSNLEVVSVFKLQSKAGDAACTAATGSI